VIRTLLERNWVKVAGHRDVPGRPAIYITTKTFLDYFNLSRLDELPSIEELMQEDGESTETPKQEKTFLPKVGLSDEVTAASSAVLDEADESLVEEPRSDSDALVTNLERNQEMVEEVDHE
jgi:segregation and condensation protein B